MHNIFIITFPVQGSLMNFKKIQHEIKKNWKFKKHAIYVETKFNVVDLYV